MTALSLQVNTCPSHTLEDSENTFAPTTSTLISGRTDAVLVDTLYLHADVAALGDLIEASGRQLTTIFITHGHADHYFGLPRLHRRFPDARVVAAPAVAAYIQASVVDEARTFGRYFRELATVPDVLPEPLHEPSIELEGHELRVVDVGQADISPTTALHIPALDAAIAGDAVYNKIHPMLALGDPDAWDRWLAGIAKIEALGARTIIAGHKKPDASDDDGPAMIDATRRYIVEFARLVKEGASVEAIVATMSASWPDYGNMTTLKVSAAAAVARSRAAAA